MKRGVQIYLSLLGALLLAWSLLRAGEIIELSHGAHWLSLLGVTALYILSHVFRMLRLALLTLDRRKAVLPLIVAHVLTAFPSSFLPFKVGEVLRLAAFFHVFESRHKALAVWLAERFGDLVIIAAFISGLYLFNASVPASMRTVFIIFVLASTLALLGLFALAKVFVYINRHLVLTSYTRHGLVLLKASNSLRRLETEIHKSIEGRLSAFFMLSLLIWCLEISALSLFISRIPTGQPDFPVLFLSSLLASLPGGTVEGTGLFGLYQSLALVALTLAFLAATWLTTYLKFVRK